MAAAAAAAIALSDLPGRHNIPIVESTDDDCDSETAGPQPVATTPSFYCGAAQHATTAAAKPSATGPAGSSQPLPQPPAPPRPTEPATKSTPAPPRARAGPRHTYQRHSIASSLSPAPAPAAPSSSLNPYAVLEQDALPDDAPAAAAAATTTVTVAAPAATPSSRTTPRQPARPSRSRKPLPARRSHSATQPRANPHSAAPATGFHSPPPPTRPPPHRDSHIATTALRGRVLHPPASTFFHDTATPSSSSASDHSSASSPPTRPRNRRRPARTAAPATTAAATTTATAAPDPADPLAAPGRRKRARLRNPAASTAAPVPATGPPRLPRRPYPVISTAPPLSAPPTDPQPRPATAKPSAADRAAIAAADIPAILGVHFRVVTRVPARHATLHSDAWQIVLELVHTSASTALGVKLMHLFPLMVLRLPPTGTSLNVLRARLTRFLRGDWRALLEEAWHAVMTPTASTTAAEPRATSAAAASEQSEEESAAAAAQHAEETRLRRQGVQAARCAQEGSFQRAMNVLTRDAELAPISAATIAHLEALHPAEPGLPDLAWDDAYRAVVNSLSPNAPLVISGKDVQSAIADADPCSAGGPSGLTVGLLRPVLLGSLHLCDLLAGFFTRLANGDPTLPAMHSLLGMCRLIALKKPNGGVRPISVGEILRRLCSRIVLRRYRKASAVALEPLQVGVGTRSGGDACVLSTRAFLDLFPGHVLVNIDLTNAFNCLSRVAICERLKREPTLRDLLLLARTFYLQECDLIVRNGSSPHYVKSRTGSQQGDTLGSLLWCLGWQDDLEGAAAFADFANSFVDDGRFATTPGNAATLLLRLRDAAARVGGSLNLSKCIAYTESGILPDDLRALGVHCVDALTPAADRGFVMQGVPIGTADFQKAWLATNLAEQKAVMLRLSTYVPDKMAAAQMLTHCIVPRITHILRALPPSVTADFATDFDAAATTCFTAIAAPDHSTAGLPPNALAKLGLKLRDGGFGIAVQARGAAAAHVAAWVGTRDLILRLCPALAPHLPPTASLPDASAAASNPLAPACVRHLLSAVADLPVAAQQRLRDTVDAAPAPAAVAPSASAAPGVQGPAPAAPDAASAAAADPAASNSGARLQSKLSRPSHSNAARVFSESLATSDHAEAAKCLSQQGWLGTPGRRGVAGVEFLNRGWSV